MDEHDNKFPSVHYLQEIDNGKEPEQSDVLIDKKEILVYEALFDALRDARANIGHRPEEVRRITELGKRFLTKEDQKSLQKVKPYHTPENIVTAQRTYE